MNNMMDGIEDMFKVIGSMVFKEKFKPDTDKNGIMVQSKQQPGEYKKMFKKLVEDGEIFRYFMYYQKSPFSKGFDDHINEARKKEVDKLNEEYYGREKYLRLKQCMPD
jgi:hypothetical protein